MGLQHLVVAAFVLYAVFYLGRYVRRMMQGKKTGCGCGSDTCHAEQPEHGGRAAESK